MHKTCLQCVFPARNTWHRPEYQASTCFCMASTVNDENLELWATEPEVITKPD